VLLFGFLQATEAKECPAAGFVGREATLEIFLDGEFQMSGHFRIEIVVELRAAKRRGAGEAIAGAS
jgi:hypothetical protein